MGSNVSTRNVLNIKNQMQRLQQNVQIKSKSELLFLLCKLNELKQQRNSQNFSAFDKSSVEEGEKYLALFKKIGNDLEEFIVDVQRRIQELE